MAWRTICDFYRRRTVSLTHPEQAQLTHKVTLAFIDCEAMPAPTEFPVFASGVVAAAGFSAREMLILSPEPA